jgi:hypothetical protein
LTCLGDHDGTGIGTEVTSSRGAGFSGSGKD